MNESHVPDQDYMRAQTGKDIHQEEIIPQARFICNVSRSTTCEWKRCHGIFVIKART